MALVCIVFLLHVRSALVAILMLPVGVLMAFGAMKLLGLGSNIMSLGGIAIAIGAMVDAAIVMIENAHKHLERAEPGRSRVDVLIEAASEVGPALFFSLLIITVSFMPIFTLESQEGRLFSPLAFTKTFAMAAAALLSVTLVPALMVIFVRGKIIPEHKNPINRFLIWIYRPVIKGVMRAKVLVILLAVAVLAVTIWPARQLGTEFMPNLNEGTLLYMPTTLPGISVTKAGELLQTQDRIIRTFPEVASVYGKAGRALTATDPGAVRDVRDRHQPQAESGMAAGRDRGKPDRGDGPRAAISRRFQRLDQPIKARIDMLSTGIRTPIGVKVIGTDLVEIDKLAKQIEQVLKAVPGTSSAYAERGIGGYYLDIVARPRGAGALRHHGAGRAGRDRDRARRPDRHHDSRGPPALRRQHALSARFARRYAIDHAATCWCRCRAAARCRSAKSPRSRRRAARPRSAPRTASSRPTSMSTSATAISAAMSPTRRPP